jgi:hypothetical protein
MAEDREAAAVGAATFTPIASQKPRPLLTMASSGEQMRESAAHGCSPPLTLSNCEDEQAANH